MFERRKKKKPNAVCHVPKKRKVQTPPMTPPTTPPNASSLLPKMEVHASPLSVTKR